ncbi:protein adenylyltransferase SelO [Anthocerotibacter panamensis]|uniref:protein adenylyltransferase SelO n=1 Tax=Anthocerotibacter panamensis TaxID=2857077 RepID=UPI001C40605D|nr:YdiU family protein [Anthocerotibacter panamensis]
MHRPNPFHTLTFEPALEALGDDYHDVVAAAEFPRHTLRFRNDALLSTLGLPPTQVTEEDWIAAFGRFEGERAFLALRYHGYQFGAYNPYLGDGRGFLWGQVRGIDGGLYDLGTKGSGTTPYSRSADGRLTLKGGVREVLAAEALHRLGVRTSRCLCLIETGEALYRSDEPAPARSSVMVRVSRSHIRFGTFERLHYLGRKDLILKLLDHVLTVYYPHLLGEPNAYQLFYTELVERTAQLAAQWMAAGFCHAVLNTDNMSITGESFDYGPWAFIPTYDPGFTAASFDYFGRYCYANQPHACRWNLEMLQRPLEAVLAPEEMAVGLAVFEDCYHRTYQERMLARLGFAPPMTLPALELLRQTIQMLYDTQVGYHRFFSDLTGQFTPRWREDKQWMLMLHDFDLTLAQQNLFASWRDCYFGLLNTLPSDQMPEITQRLRQHNPDTVLLRPVIEAVWNPIVYADNWEPFYALLQEVSAPARAGSPSIGQTLGEGLDGGIVPE